MNLADPDLELLDPTPNVYNLFIHFDRVFFWTKLASRAVVRWSKRMYSCAGICSYEGRGGLCDIALSEPLLKLRPRKDLIETLLHEMIHAYLFITCRDRERDGHGPNFQAHMKRINKSAGLNISIYHDFHDEVKLYQTHWWRCNGPCQKMKPYFGIVRRSQNRAPGPNDFWWNTHKKNCGGTFQKIKEPEKHIKKTSKEKNTKNNGDITKFIKDKAVNPKNTNTAIKKPLTPLDNNINTSKTMKTNSKINDPKKPIIISNVVKKNDVVTSKSDSVIETVRSVWANKQLSNSNKTLSKSKSIDSNIHKPTKSKASHVHSDSPPSKQIKLDSFFKNTATSLLKDVYGKDFELTNANNKIIAVNIKLVDCPICGQKVDEKIINTHLDECLNKDIIEKISKDNFQVLPEENNITPTSSETKSNANAETSPLYKKQNIINDSKESKIKDIKKEIKRTDNDNFNANTLNKDTKSNNSANTRRSDNFLVSNGALDKVNVTFLDDMGMKPQIKSEPVSSEDTKPILPKQNCPCCGEEINKPVPEHLDECLAFFDNNSTIPEEGASTSFINTTIVLDDDDDIFDETLTLNATGSKTPCPCCMEMIELSDMNAHLDSCLT